ncbi:uncharacterized protein [Eurosta solidaginis]|uniref:uncharacterized protein n=1 Tax=Eurosta solidaginis TaxID=178769 RepID=UPI003530C78D
MPVGNIYVHVYYYGSRLHTTISLFKKKFCSEKMQPCNMRLTSHGRTKFNYSSNCRLNEGICRSILFNSASTNRFFLTEIHWTVVAQQLIVYTIIMPYRRCVRGCPLGATLHEFPAEEEMSRRLEWMQLLGVTGSAKKFKHIFACRRHFSSRMFKGKYLSKDATPDLDLSTNSSAVEVGRENNGCSRIRIGSSDYPAVQYPLIELGVEDFVPIGMSRNVESASTSNNDLIEYEVLSESIQPIGFEELSSPLVSSGVQTEAFLTDGTPRKRKYQKVM